MGTSFFKPKDASVGAVTPKSFNLEARALGAPSYGGKAAGAGASKDLGAALAINKAGSHKKLTGGSDYPKGPKV